MHTELLTVDRNRPDGILMAKAADILRQGGLVAFPTETVYGLGANGLDERAVRRIYEAKGRPSDNPLILHISDVSEVENLVADIPANARALMECYWPGPLTLVLLRRPVVPDIVTGGLDTVAIRFPDSEVARQLIRLAGVPVAGPSANLSGRPSPTTAQAVWDDLNGRIEAILDAGPCQVGVESTVVDCTTPVPTLLRPGGITLERLTDTLGVVEVDPALGGVKQDVVPRSPGMKYKHYAPKAPMTLLEGETGSLVKRLRQEIDRALASGRTVGVVVADETAALLPAAVKKASYGSRQDTARIAANLYTALRSFDDRPVDLIFGEGISEAGLGLAVMNRLRKASGYNIIRV